MYLTMGYVSGQTPYAACANRASTLQHTIHLASHGFCPSRTRGEAVAPMIWCRSAGQVATLRGLGTSRSGISGS